MDWLKKNRDWLITLAVFLFFACVLLLYNIFFKDNEIPIPAPLEIRETVTFDLTGEDNSQPAETPDASGPLQSAAFFLQPGPEELFRKLEQLNRLEFKEELKKLPSLKIMWPAYFFSLERKSEQMAEIVLDSSEDGFGVVLISEIDIQRYPEILTLHRGEKIWLAAEIKGVDPSGTGQFILATEYIRFGDYQPPAQRLNTAESKGN